jgi:hypothetical protein
MDRGISASMVLGVAAMALVMAGRPQSSSGTSNGVPDARAVAQVDSTTRETRLPDEFRKGEELLEAFFGDTLPETRELRGTHFDFDVLLAALPDPYESRLDWIHDSVLAALQRAFETGGFVLDRYWTPDPSDTLSAWIGGTVSSVPAPRVHPGVLLFRSWAGGGSEADTLRLRLVYLVGEVPTRGVHIPALRNALSERDRLMVDLPSTSVDSTTERRTSVKIIGPVFSGSSYSYRRVLDQWLTDPAGGLARANTSVRIISGSATSPGNKGTLEGLDSPVSFHATVNSDDVLMGALDSLVLAPLGIEWGQVAVLQESTTAYGQSLNPGQGTDRPLVIPFPMNISLLRGEYARLPALDQSVDLIPQISEGPRVRLSLQDRERSPETPASVSRMTAPALDIIIEEIIRILKARDIRAVGLMATDVRDKLFLGELIKRRLSDVQLFTLESNVLLRAPDYRDALRGMLILSTYPLFLENQGRVRGGAVDQGLSFSNDGAQGAYNAALLFLGLDDAMVGYAEPGSTCSRMDKEGTDTTAVEGGSPRRPPVWLTAVGKTSFLPISCLMPMDTAGYLAEVAGAGPSDRAAAGVSVNRPKRGLLVRGALLLLVLSSWLLFLYLFRESPLERDRAQPGTTQPHQGSEASAPGGDSHPEDEWDLQNASHLIHLGIYRGALFVALGGLVIPLGFPLHLDDWGWLVLIMALVPVTAGLILESQRAIRLSLRWKSRGLRKAGFGRRARHVKGRGLREGQIWFIEIVARSFVASAGIVLGGLLIWYASEVSHLERAAPGAFDLFVQRASQWGGGISPLVPLTYGLLGVVGWCVWHWVRIEILLGVRPFEDSCFPRADSPEAESDPGRVPQAWSEGWTRVEEGIRNLRTRLFLLIPDQTALTFAVFMGFASGWLLWRMGPTLERAALNPAGLQFSAWPILLKAFIVAGILITTWSIFRFLSVWASLREVLAAVLETPLVPAFNRLPRRVARFTRLAVFEGASQTMLGSISGTQLKQLDEIFSAAREGTRSPDEVPEEVRSVVEAFSKAGSEKLFLDAGRSVEDGKALTLLRNTLTALWCREPDESTIEKLREDLEKGADKGQANTAWLIRTRFPHRLGLWMRGAEELLATQIVAYIGWALRQVRWLAIFLLLSLLFTTGMISSYPFGNQGEVKIFFFFVAVAGIGSLTAAMVQMNRNDLLSRFNGSDPGRVTWSARFVINLILFAGIPLLAVLSSAFPPLRNLLSAWMGPMAGMLTSF